MRFIYLKMEREIGHTLLTPLGAHFSWLLWGRSRSASFLRGHQNIERCAARRADTPSKYHWGLSARSVPKMRGPPHFVSSELKNSGFWVEIVVGAMIFDPGELSFD